MTDQELSIYKAIIFKAVDKMKINKYRRIFFVEIIGLFLSIKGKLNFLQFERYSSFSEQRFRNRFEQQFDFLSFNIELVLGHCSQHCIICFDPSHINKTGKSTPGVGYFWSGCASKMKWGLEIGGIAAIDIEHHTALHLQAVQTCNLKDQESLLDYYGNILVNRKIALQKISKYVVVDAYFSKNQFVKLMCANDFHVVSRFRDDADLRYLYKGKQSGKRGRPRKYIGKVDLKNFDKSYFESVTIEKDYEVWSGIVHSKSLKKDINLILYRTKKKDLWTTKLYFTTDLNMGPKKILEYYQARFQIEFLYRDAKQHTGLNDCQARSKEKLDFHFNASLTTINIAKIVHWIKVPKGSRNSFSMTDVKTMYHNELLLKRFINVFGINPNSEKNKRIICELITYGKIAA